MNYKQLVPLNLNANGNIGFCLAYAQAVFGHNRLYADATTAWQNTKYKHLDQNFPNVAVPIWFSYKLNGVDLGHVAVRLPNGQIYSSPWEQGTTHAVLNSIPQLISIYSDNQKNPMKYLGWSEDIEELRVAQPDIINDMPTPAEVNLAFAAVLNRQATNAEKKLYSTRSWDNFLQTLYNNSTSQRAKASNYDKLQASYNALKAQTGDTSDATLLGKALIPILSKLGYKRQ